MRFIGTHGEVNAEVLIVPGQLRTTVEGESRRQTVAPPQADKAGLHILLKLAAWIPARIIT
ncbi:hypothetical protein ACTXQV_65070, partial [Klebsiella pneumoniae]